MSSSPRVASEYSTCGETSGRALFSSASRIFDASRFVHAEVARRAGRFQQLVHDALVDVRVLPRIDAGEVEPEDACRAAQRAQPPARELRRAVRFERRMQRGEVGGKLFGGRVGRCRRVPAFRMAELRGGRGKPRLDCRDGAPIEFLVPVLALGRAFGEATDFVRASDQPRVERELSVEPAQLLQMEYYRAAAVQLQRLAQHRRSDERIAVAVAADPAAEPEERSDAGALP